MAEKFYTTELPNGMTVLGQQMPNVSSAAVALLVPAGAAHCPADEAGAAAVACEWCTRGAGDRDTRQFNEALDSLGCNHHQTVQSEHIVLSAAQLGCNLPNVLEIYGDVLRRCRLGSETFESCRALIVQDLASLEDEPARKCAMLLREKFYPSPLGRCVYGDSDSLQAIEPDAVRRHVAEGFNPRGTILAAAGDIDWPRLSELSHRLFSDWAADQPAAAKVHAPVAGVTHIHKDSAQTHIALAHRSVPAGSDHYYAARVAEMVLSGGMASRLFTEVREKRGLVYHVSSRYHSLKDHAGMFTYAGTTPEKAQETFDVTVGELRRLAEGIEPDEMNRAKTQLKSAMVMRGQSTQARAGAISSDWYHLHRIRSLKELSEAIDRVSTEDVLAYLSECPAGDFTVLVIGPEQPDTGAIGE